MRSSRTYRALISGWLLLLFSLGASQVLAQAEAEEYTTSEDESSLWEEPEDTTWTATANSYEGRYSALQPVFAKDEPERPSRINASEWEELTKGLSYRQQEPTQPVEGIQLPAFVGEGLGILVWIAVILILLAIVYVLVRSYQRTEEFEVDRKTSLTDELLAASDDELAEALQRNLEVGNFRVAISYRFGQLLQVLRAAGLLMWVPGKTNADYLLELPLLVQASFGDVSSRFGYANYSGRAIEQRHFEAFEIAVRAVEQAVTEVSAPAGGAKPSVL